MKQRFDFASGVERRVVLVGSDDYPDITDDAPAGHVMVRTGAGRSTLTVPVLPGAILR